MRHATHASIFIVWCESGCLHLLSTVMRNVNGIDCLLCFLHCYSYIHKISIHNATKLHETITEGWNHRVFQFPEVVTLAPSPRAACASCHQADREGDCSGTQNKNSINQQSIKILLVLGLLSLNLLSISMAFPAWATPGENRKLFGKAQANGADALILSDFDATTGFLDGKLGECISLHVYFDDIFILLLLFPIDAIFFGQVLLLLLLFHPNKLVRIDSAVMYDVRSIGMYCVLFYPYHNVTSCPQNGLQKRLLYASSVTTGLGLIQLRSSLEEEPFWHVHTPWSRSSTKPSAAQHKPVAGSTWRTTGSSRASRRTDGASVPSKIV